MMICGAQYAQIGLLHLVLSSYPTIFGILQARLLIVLLPPRKLRHVAFRFLISLLFNVALLPFLAWMIFHLGADVGILVLHFDCIILKLLVPLSSVVLSVIRSFNRIIVCAVHYV